LNTDVKGKTKISVRQVQTVLKLLPCPQRAPANNCLKIWVFKPCHIVSECGVENPTLSVGVVERHDMSFSL